MAVSTMTKLDDLDGAAGRDAVAGTRVFELGERNTCKTALMVTPKKML